ncbi:hypothetical protein [Hymenobacter metallilatus]|uniref:Uncharacterized protein n=1 Tax=Hymenobacter metallilatus TaxID=2493666 RepID=A0A3R9NIT5_9BACT|nr:hypothetical protein [Hymenobacter metallilatus]RSK33946.1 hypothetical protein EI290_09580 [Hymenobacter metallilatus]
MAKHLITPDLDHALRQFAARMPEPAFANGAPQPGAVLASQYPDLLTIHGQPLVGHKLYLVVTKHTRRRHLRELRRVYRAGGRPALVKHLQPYADFLKTE